MTVLDASALLAYVLDEPVADVVEDVLVESGSIGTVNLAEVLTKLADIGEDPRTAAERIRTLPIEIVPFDEELAVEAAALRPLTSSTGLSLGHRACLALGRRLGGPVMTADAAWADPDAGVQIRVIRRRG